MEKKDLNPFKLNRNKHTFLLKTRISIGWVAVNGDERDELIQNNTMLQHVIRKQTGKRSVQSERKNEAADDRNDKKTHATDTQNPQHTLAIEVIATRHRHKSKWHSSSVCLAFNFPLSWFSF